MIPSKIHSYIPEYISLSSKSYWCSADKNPSWKEEKNLNAVTSVAHPPSIFPAIFS